MSIYVLLLRPNVFLNLPNNSFVSETVKYLRLYSLRYEYEIYLNILKIAGISMARAQLKNVQKKPKLTMGKSIQQITNISLVLISRQYTGFMHFCHQYADRCPHILIFMIKKAANE